jgi:hypothetical protein
MLIEQTIEKLYDMKLNGMVDALKDQLQQATSQDLSFEERFALIVDRQWIWKEDRRMKRLLQNAHLKINGCIEDIDYRSPRGLDKSVILSLANCDWITRAQNIIITGSVDIVAPGFFHRKKDLLLFHVTIEDTLAAEIFIPSDLKETEIVGMIHHAHLIRIAVDHSVENPVVQNPSVKLSSSNFVIYPHRKKVKEKANIGFFLLR